MISVRDGKCERRIREKSCPAASLAISSDNQTIAIASEDGSLGTCRISSPSGLRTIREPGDKIRNVTLDPSGKESLIIFQRSHPAIFDPQSREWKKAFTGLSGNVTCFTIAPGGSCFAAAGDDGMLRIWRRDRHVPVLTIPLYHRHMSCAEFSQDARLLVAGFDDGTIRVIVPEDKNFGKEWKAHGRAVSSIAISPEGNQLLSTRWDGYVRLWNIPGRELVRTLSRQSGAVTGISLIEDTGLVIAGYSDGTVRQFDREGNLIRPVDVYTPEVIGVAANREGSLLACAGKDSTRRIWSPADGGLISSCEGFPTTMRCLAFLPGRDILAAGGWDGKIRLWEMPAGRLIRTFAGHTSYVTCIAVSPDGSMIAPGSNDGMVRLWDVEVERHKARIVISEDKGEVSALALDPAGTNLAVAGKDGSIRFYRSADGRPGGSVEAFPGTIRSRSSATAGFFSLGTIPDGWRISPVRKRRFSTLFRPTARRLPGSRSSPMGRAW